jgi:hypothetical protein
MRPPVIEAKGYLVVRSERRRMPLIRESIEPARKSAGH